MIGSGRIGLLYYLVKQHLVPCDFVGGLQEFVRGRLVFLYEVLVTDLANSIVLFNEFTNKSMGVLSLVNVVDV